jgi:hypothetical protein
MRLWLKGIRGKAHKIEALKRYRIVPLRRSMTIIKLSRNIMVCHITCLIWYHSH